MKREFVCIMCPQGCRIEAEWSGGKIESITGNTCPKGMDYVTRELVNPMRNIATSVLVENGELELAGVRLTNPIPKSRIFDVVAEIKKILIQAPVHIGQVVVADVLGLGSDVVVTKNVGVANDAGRCPQKTG